MRSSRLPGAVLTEHTFRVPLDHANPGGPHIEVFGREIAAADRADQDLPWLLFLQGGPGFGSPRPLGPVSWRRALTEFRVLLLDQRGTGRSTPATRQTLAHLDAEGQARYLGFFRADSIVRDAEAIRRALTGGQPWSVLGQSFGGFCAVTYLSLAPEGLREVLIAGGLPGLDATAEEVYRLTYPLVAAKTAEHYRRYPHDVEQARAVGARLREAPAALPGGGLLTLEAFAALGRMLGTSTGSHELHYLLEDPFAGNEMSDSFLHAAHARLSFASAPLYAVLHEACYAQGGATRWAADRVAAELGGFGAAALDQDGPLPLTGEMIFPWMFRTDPALRPLRDAAQLLAERDDWPPLYDPARLSANEAPAAAVVYYHDMYVPRELSMRTAGRIAGLRTWVTSEYEHDGLRVSDGAVLDRLIALARGNA